MLEYARVFGDGGSTLLLVFGVIGAVVGLWVLMRS